MNGSLKFCEFVERTTGLDRRDSTAVLNVYLRLELLSIHPGDYTLRSAKLGEQGAIVGALALARAAA